MKRSMRRLHRIYPIGHGLISLMFLLCALALLVLAADHLLHVLNPAVALPRALRMVGVIESIAVLTVAVATLELSQTILEEEVQREAHMSAPTRVRRFLSRFMVVLVVALSIETLVIVFRASHEAPEQLPYAAAVGLAAAALLAAWGGFVHLNRSAEELEPEAMELAKEEDQKVR